METTASQMQYINIGSVHLPLIREEPAVSRFTGTRSCIILFDYNQFRKLVTTTTSLLLQYSLITMLIISSDKS